MPLPVFTTFYTGQTDYVEKLNTMVTDLNSLGSTISTAETNASTSASLAATSAGQAATSASNASTSASNASTSASNASTSATLSGNYANYNVGTLVPGTSDYSAKHWAYMGLNIKFKGSWNSTSYPTSPTQGDRWVISENVTISGTAYLAGESIAYNGSTWSKIPITDSSIPALVSARVLTNNGTNMSWTNSLTSFTLATPTISSPTISGTITASAVPTVSGTIHFTALRIKGSGTGNANIATITFYESDGVTRKGFIGDGSAANQHTMVGSDFGEVWAWENAGAQQGRVWHAGNDGTGSGLDADLWDGNQFSAYLNQAVLTTSSPTFANVSTSANAYVGIGTAATVRDIATANTIRIQGTADATKGYIIFGNGNTASLGRTGTGALTYNGSTVWHAGNDGTGSGLDADLLDGMQPATAATISTIAQRDASGILTATQFNSTNGTTAFNATRFYASNDTNIKCQTAADFKKSLARADIGTVVTDTTVEVGKHYPVNTTAGVITLKLPARSDTTVGDYIDFSNVGLMWETNNLTVTKATADTGVYIQQLQEDLVCDQNIGGFRLKAVFKDGSTVYWNIV